MKVKIILFSFSLFFCLSCKGEKNIIMDAKDVYATQNVEVKVYDFENFEPLLSIKDGKTRIINFWATWCKPCIVELPYFELINSRYTNDKVEVILVSLDFPHKIDETLIPFLEDQNIKSKVILLDDPDADYWIPVVNDKWSGSIPATLIYKGNTSNFYEQSFTYNELEKELKKIL